jgi:NAD(P)-dependent dehydrogenase (short-subunit alcohol dehydrogenase family)
MGTMKRTALITGATRGIGKATAVLLAKRGYQLVLNYIADEDAARESMNICRGFGADVLLCRADISIKTEAVQLLDACMKRFSGIDVLICNAGVNIDKPMLEMSEEEWDKVVDVNMKGTFLVAQATAGHMLCQDTGGHIILTGATTGIRGRKNGINYCASKAGVIVMTKCMAMELAPKIRVNCIIPGFTLTDETAARFDLGSRLEEETKKRNIPLDRIGRTEEIAAAIGFLISEEAGYINGQKLIVDGGQYMY